MFVDARTLPAGTLIEADICIVGAGAAGITLARELADGHHQVAIIESGGFEPDAADQELYAGRSVGVPFSPIDADRLRFLGGTTNHWDGSCKPFDPIDFERRDYIPYSGWPFGRGELEPFYRRAQKICQLGPYTYDPADWAEGEDRAFSLDEAPRLRTGMFQNSPPTRFGVAYRADLAGLPMLRVYLHANVTAIETNAEASAVTALRVACRAGGPSLTVRAGSYVLAAGGIEHPRLLLVSDAVETAGLGNAHDLVGRFFMDHPNLGKTADIVFARSYPNLAFYDYHVVRGIKVCGYLTATAEAQRRAELPNFSISLDRGQLADQSTAAAALRAIYKSARSGHWPDHLAQHLGQVLGDLDGLADLLYERAADRQPALYSTFYSCECPPDPASRVALVRETDALGLRRVQLDWRLPGDFIATMRRAHRLLGEELGRAGLGRLRVNATEEVEDPLASVENGHHHMGTTRMHVDPRQGVVDADCRVHGTANLYIAGSSVFPTYSLDDPTMTIVALALRLADHLKTRGV